VNHDPSLKEVKYSLKQLEFQLLTTGLAFVKTEVSNDQCERMEVVVNQALLEAQNILLKALKIINTPALLSLCPKNPQPNKHTN
jgi:hypothetical protein